MAFKDTVGICPAKLDTTTENLIKDLTAQAVAITGCFDCTRVDFRLSHDNIPYILDINANSAIGPDDGSTRSAFAAGYSYPQFLDKIVQSALKRYKNQSRKRSSCEANFLNV